MEEGIKKTNNGYKVDFYPAGRDGPRPRKEFKTLSQAKAFKKHCLAKYSSPEPWEPQKKDMRTISELAKKWYELHGQTLKKGERRMSEFKNLIEVLDDPVAQKLTAADYTKARAKRLKSVSIETANRDLTNLCSVYNELRRQGEINYPNPLADVKKLNVPERELSYLTSDKITTLINALDEVPTSHARISARICLETGARWGETLVKASQVGNKQITFVDTKNRGKKRTIPISKELEELILEHAPIIDGMKIFKETVKRIKLQLPKGQMTHVLRHTFASHYMINGGNIIQLARTLDHSDLKLTMRYAHLSPDYMEEVRKLNPLADLNLY